jgi:hypothetical protein
MLAIEVRLNGELKATCGADDLRHLIAMLNILPPGKSKSGGEEGLFRVEVHGVRPSGLSTEEVLKWVSARVQLGDEIAFRLVEVAEAHEPIDRQVIAKRDRGLDA